MRILLDTHTLLWAAFDEDSLSARARRIVQSPSNEIIVSAASAWEVATKYRLGKLDFAQDLAENFVSEVTAAGYLLLPITPEHAQRSGLLIGTHKDPFDRMLAAQAIHENISLLSNDPLLDVFGVRREW
jgi:PIN domain nuclease of toxin-antitoxin system